MSSAANPTPTSALLRNIELDASRGDVIQQLREALFTHAVRVIDLFKEWDKDWSGAVTRKEFRRALPMLGLLVPDEQSDALFDSFDADGTGSIEYKELNRALRSGAEHVLAPALQPGGAGPIARTPTVKHEVRKADAPTTGRQARFERRQSVYDGATAEETARVVAQLREALLANFTKVVDMLTEWDAEINGAPTGRAGKVQFRRAFATLGVKASNVHVDALSVGAHAGVGRAPALGGRTRVGGPSEASRRGPPAKHHADGAV